MASPPNFGPVLDRLRRDAELRLGVYPVHFALLERRERPFTHLLRVSVHESAVSRPLTHFFVKIFKVKPDIGLEAMRERIRRDFDVNSRVHAATLNNEDFGVVPPVACYPELLTIVTEQVDGPTLLNHLRAEAGWFATPSRIDRLCRTVQMAGRWIRTFQESVEDGEYVSIQDLRDYIDVRLQRLVHGGRGVLSPGQRARLLQHIDRLSGRIAHEDLKRVVTHSDLALGNIIVSDGRIVVLDFAMTKSGTRYHDLARLSLQIELLAVKPHSRTSVIRKLQTALLSGFDSASTGAHPLFRLLTLLHRINHLTTISVNSVPFPERLYNLLVRSHHRRRLGVEVGSEPGSVFP